MHEMRRRKHTKPTLLLTQGIFNFTHHIGMVQEELGFGDAVKSYTAGKWIVAQLNVMAVMGLIPVSPESLTPYVNQLSYLLTHHTQLRGSRHISMTHR